MLLFLLSPAADDALCAARPLLPHCDRFVAKLQRAGASGPPPDFLVNVTTNEADADPGDGFCLTSLGECTARAGVEEMNAGAGGQKLGFLIPGAGPHEIPQDDMVPLTITAPSSTIDCSTQPGSVLGTGHWRPTHVRPAPQIVFTGTGGILLTLDAAGGAIVNCGFSGSGATAVFITDDGDGSRVQASAFSDLLKGVEAKPIGSTDLLIGGTTSGQGNWFTDIETNPMILGEDGGSDTGNEVSGNEASASATGFVVYGQSGARLDRNWGHDCPTEGCNCINIVGSSQVTVQRNVMGTNRQGTAADPCAVGIHLTNSDDTLIGHLTNPALGNITSGNIGSGVSVESGSDTIIANNRIGVDIAGGPLCNGDPQIDDNGTGTVIVDNIECVPTATPTPTPTPTPTLDPSFGCCPVSGNSNGITCFDSQIVSPGTIASESDCDTILPFAGGGDATDFFAGGACPPCEPGPPTCVNGHDAAGTCEAP